MKIHARRRMHFQRIPLTLPMFYGDAVKHADFDNVGRRCISIINDHWTKKHGKETQELCPTPSATNPPERAQCAQQVQILVPNLCW